MHYHIKAVKARPDFKLWVRFADGVEGEADLSDIAGRGVFARWIEHPEEFDQVSIDPQTGAPYWPGDLDVAPGALYRDIANSVERAPLIEP